MYPALSVLQAIGSKVEAVLWVGGQGGMEADLVARKKVAFTAIPAAGVHGVGLRTLPGNLVKLAQGWTKSRRILAEFKPDVIFYTGGFVAVPMAFASSRIPSVLYVPDIEPGLALKTLARRASAIALTAGESRQYFSPKKTTVVTGYPIRPELSEWNREKARKALGLTSELPVLLIFGGSKGAHLINTAVFPALNELCAFCQVIHLCGAADYPEALAAKAALPSEMVNRYLPFDYLHEEMGAVLAAADLAVSRAGASTLGELPHFGLPAILVPYPFAWRYQKVNADYLAAHGAAEVIENAELPLRLVPEVKKVLTSPELLSERRKAMSSLKVDDAAEKIADLILKKGQRNAKEEK